MVKINLEILRSEMMGDLNRYNIHLLREQGSKLGVKSVTTHKKEKLVELIIEKKLQNHKSYETDRAPEYSSEVSVLDKEWLLERLRNPDETQGEMVSGTIELNDNIDGFLRLNVHKHSPEDVFIPQGIINERKLKYGDHIVGKAVQLQNQDFRGLISVMSINGQKLKGFARRDFSEIPATYPNVKIPLWNSGDRLLRMMDVFSPIAKGQRNMIFSKGLMNRMELFSGLIKTLNENNIKTTVLCLSESPEMVSSLKNTFGDCIISTISESNTKNNERVAQFTVERLKREAEIGKNVAIIVSNMASLYAGGSRQTLTKEFNFKSLFGSGRQLENGGSLTVIGFSFLLGQIGEHIYESLVPIANSVTVLKPENLQSTWPIYDVYSSFSDYFDNNDQDKEIFDIVRNSIVAKDGVCDEVEILHLYKTLQRG